MIVGCRDGSYGGSEWSWGVVVGHVVVVGGVKGRGVSWCVMRW